MELIVIRVDGDNKIGMGHVTRTIDIAKELQKKDYEVIFLIRDVKEVVVFLEEHIFKTEKLKSDKKHHFISIKKIEELHKEKIDLIIVDLLEHEYSKKYVEEINKYCKKLIVLSYSPDQNYFYPF